MKDKLIQYLQEAYQPDAIVLHGSRARGYERELSDWDIILLYNNPTDFKSGRELFEMQNIEVSVYALPITDIYATFSAKLQGAVVLYEKNGEGAALVAQANEFYARGVHWPAEKLATHKLWFQGRLDGMRDSTDAPLMFYKYFGDVYDRVGNYWYWITQHQHSQPLYVAIKEIQERDPQYYALLQELTSSDSSLAKKVQIAEQLRDRLFK